MEITKATAYASSLYFIATVELRAVTINFTRTKQDLDGLQKPSHLLPTPLTDA